MLSGGASSTWLHHQHILHDQILQIRPIEHVQRVGRRAHHGLATTVQRGIEGHTVAGELLQLHHQVVPAWVVAALQHLGAGGTILVHDLGYPVLPLLIDLEGEGHEGAGVVDLEHLGRHGIEHGRAERAPAFAELDLFVDPVGDPLDARAADDGAAAQGPRAELHAPLEPGDRIALHHDLDLEGEGHEGAGVVDLEHLGRHGIEHGRAERAPAFAELDLFVDPVGDPLDARAADDGAAAQGPRAELHAPLEPGDRIALHHDPGDTLGHIVDLLPLGLVRVAGAGGNDILVAVAGTEVDVFHLLHRHAILHRDVGGGTDSGTGIAGSGLDEQLLDLGAGNDLLVEFDVQRAAAGKGDLAGFTDDIAQVVVHHFQRQLLEQGLHAGGIMDVGVVGDVAFALGPQPLDQLGREVVALALFLVTAEADDVGVVGIDDQLAVLELGQTGEIVLGGVTIRRHAHDLELAIQHLEAQVLGQRAVEAAQGIRVIELLDLVDLAILTVAEEGGGILTLAVDAQNRGLLLEAGTVIGAGG